MDDAQKEEGPAGEQHSVGARILPVRLDALPIFIPFHSGGRAAFGFTVKGGWFPFGHN